LDDCLCFKNIAGATFKGYTLKTYIWIKPRVQWRPLFCKNKYCHALTWASNIYRFGWWSWFNSSYKHVLWNNGFYR
jgi:phenylacetate-CoA ligase